MAAWRRFVIDRADQDKSGVRPPHSEETNSNEPLLRNRRRSVILILVLVAATALPVRPQPAMKFNAFKRDPSSKALKWANDQLRKMSLEEKIGQLISVGVNATFLTRIPTLIAPSSITSKTIKSVALFSFVARFMNR